MTQIPESAPSANDLDMKAGTFTVPTLCIRRLAADALDGFLSEQIARLPKFFDQAPLVIDLSQYGSDEALEDFPSIVGTVRAHGLIPVGVRGASALQKEQAEMLELAVMPTIRPLTQRPEPRVVAAANPPPAAPPVEVVDRPVRSGQRIYTPGDLVLTANVSSGAEVIAGGNVHAYAPLGGRVMAGVNGHEGARIFCRRLNAELVSIAGRYKVNEDIAREHLGRSIQISLQGDSLEFKPL